MQAFADLFARRRAGVVLAVLILLSCAGMSFGQPLKAVMTDTAPVIDGDLSDACWQMATPVTEFFEKAGVPAPEPTTAWILYDAENVYVAFDCKDSRPERICAQQTKRGGSLSTDDHVTVYLDLFSEYRDDSLSYFSVNAGGTQAHEVRSPETAKTEWAGDWDAAAKRNPDGYSVEMRIPFAILRYDWRNPKISVAFERSCPRLDKSWTAPDLGQNHDLSKIFLWDGVKPPEIRPKPVTLLYALVGTGSEDNPKRIGADVKYSITPSLTGLLTLNPDFRNVEQQVESVDFTYNEQVLDDSRLFFQEGRTYFPGAVVYYTRRIRDIDTGVKVVGMAGDYQVGFANTRRFGHESYTVAEMTRQFGRHKELSVWTGGVLSEVEGSENLAGFLTVDYKWRHTEDRATDFHYTIINADDRLGTGDGALRRFTAETDNGPRKANFTIEWQNVDSDFRPYLGAGRDLGIKSWAGRVELFDRPQTGRVSRWEADLYYRTSDLTDGTPFERLVSPSFSFTWRNGTYVDVDYDDYKRGEFHDRVSDFSYGWNRNDLYRSGSFTVSFGNRMGGDYVYWSLDQGFRLSDSLSMKVWTEYAKLDPPSPRAGSERQTIISASYDITPEKGIVGRWIHRSGKDNVYLAYRQHVRAGLDAYLIYGNPNSDETTDTILLKLITPLW